jgi:hypothetical protein
MISQFNRLSLKADGRYATDLELEFIEAYIQSYPLRLRVYRKLQAAEIKIVQEVFEKLQKQDPRLLRSDGQDLSAKWKRDTVRVLRYSALAMLTDDDETFKERFLSWFQTIMRAFGAQKSCDATYAIMQEILPQYLTVEEVHLVLPVLELTQHTLGVTA